MSRTGDDAWFPALCVLAGYVVIAQGLGSLYPFSTFEMYAGASTHSASRLLARDAGGAMHEIREFGAYRCGPLDLQPVSCRSGGEYYTIGYVEREAGEYLASHSAASPASDARPVDLVRRIWRFHGAGKPALEDCVVASCEAVVR